MAIPADYSLTTEQLFWLLLDIESKIWKPKTRIQKKRWKRDRKDFVEDISNALCVPLSWRGRGKIQWMFVTEEYRRLKVLTVEKAHSLLRGTRTSTTSSWSGSVSSDHSNYY
jgi:hypothetical protein